VQPFPEYHRLRIIEAVEMVRVIPHHQLVESPQREVFYIALDFPDRGLVIVVVEVGGEVDAAVGFLRHRGAAPCSGSEASLVVTRCAEEFAGACDHAARVVADDAHAATRPVLDAVSFRADARRDRQLHGERRFTVTIHPGLAALSDLPFEHLAEVHQHLVCLRGQDQPERVHRRDRRLDRNDQQGRSQQAAPDGRETDGV